MQFLQRKVAVPLWFLIFGAFSLVVALINRLLVPSVRWFFRSRANNAIHQVNDRLQLRLPEFKLTRRKELVGRVTYDPKVMEAVAEMSHAEDIPRDVLMERVERYAQEIVPAFNAYVYFHFGAWIATKISNLCYRVRLGYVDEASLRRLNPNDSIVFVMNHRSNMDYVLLGLIAMNQAALSYAVGEWARVFPVQQLVKAMGGFFVRRKSGNALYRRVLERYVQMATEAGVVQAMFPEGRLTRDGKLQEPRLGLLDYMLRTFDREGDRDIVMVPVAVNYDRVLEDRNLLQSIDPNRPPMTRWESTRNSIWFIFHNLQLMWQGGWYRFGYAVVNIGTPISTRAYALTNDVHFDQLPKAERIEHAKQLAAHLMDGVGAVVPVLPVAVVATVFTQSNSEWLTDDTIHERSQILIDQLKANGAHIYVPRDDQTYTITVGIRNLLLRHLIIEHNNQFRANIAESPMLNYYANSIIHLL